MKANLILLCLVLGLNANAQPGPGTINFFNNANTHITLFNTGLGNLGSIPPNAGEFRFELFIAPVGTSNPLQFTSTGIFGTNQASPGRFTGGGQVAVPGVFGGEHRAILVRGWSSWLGNDYETARSNWDPFFNGYLGESLIAPDFIFGGFDGTSPYPTSTAFGGSWGIQSGFALVGVPEPTSAALLGLGLALGGAIRRKT